MQAIAIILLCVLASVAYGITHDQVTARICLEYFTIGHPPVFATTDPTLLGIGWGVLATWWVGLLLGIPMAVVARLGRRPKRDAASLIKPLSVLLGTMAVLALIAGLIGRALASHGMVVLIEPLASRVPRERHVAFLGVLWAHSASYLAGLAGGIAVMVLVWRSRHQPPSNATGVEA